MIVVSGASRAGVDYVLYTSLTGADRPDHPVGEPMADHAVTDEQVAAMLSGLTDRPVRHERLTDERVVADAVGHGRSPLLAQTVAGFAPATREGLFDVVERTTGRSR
jgi:hypothetical protein